MGTANTKIVGGSNKSPVGGSSYVHRGRPVAKKGLYPPLPEVYHGVYVYMYIGTNILFCLRSLCAEERAPLKLARHLFYKRSFFFSVSAKQLM